MPRMRLTTQASQTVPPAIQGYFMILGVKSRLIINYSKREAAMSQCLLRISAVFVPVSRSMVD